MQSYLQPRQFRHCCGLVFNIACKPRQVAYYNSDPFIFRITAELHHLLKRGPVCGSTRFSFVAEQLQHFQFFVLAEIIAFADLCGQIRAVATYLIVAANTHVDHSALHCFPSKCLSRIRRINSATETPSFWASLWSAFFCRSVR